MELDELKKKYAELGAEIERLESDRWPRVGDEYYIIDLFGNVDESCRIGEEDVEYLYRRVFRTCEAAETYKLVQDRLVELRGEWKPDWNDPQQPKYHLFYNHVKKVFNVKKVFKPSTYHYIQVQGAEYMPEHAAKTLLEEFTTEEIKIWAGIEQ